MSNEDYEEVEDDVEKKSMYFVLFAVLLAVVLVLSKLLHERPVINSFLSEAALTLIIGMLAGFVVNLFLPGPAGEYDEENDENVVAHTLLSFNPNVFFMAMLPPIIFNSGYQLRRELFYRHFKPIVMFACLGTTITALTTAFILAGLSAAGWMGDIFKPTMLELLTFGALIAATDTVSVLAVFQAKRVDPHLFYLVFGESALNDAVALVLFNTFADFLVTEFQDAGRVALRIFEFLLSLLEQAMFSPTLGIVLSFGIALIFKHVDFRDHPKLELPLYLLLMYIPFVLAECFHLSGIVTIFFSGLSARRYIAPNVSKETETNSEVIFKLVANLAETCIFLELGLSVFGLPQTFAWAFIGWAFLAALVGRAAGIYPLAFLYNFSLKEVTKTEQEDENKYPADLIRSVSSISSVESLSTIASALTNGSSPQRKTPPKRKDKQISLSFTHILWFAGLRGAVAYACARKFPDVYGHADEFTAATIVVVLVTIIFMGGATEHLLRLLGIKMNVDEEEYMKQWHKERRLTGRFHTLEYNYIYRFVVRDPPVIPETGRHHTKKQEFPEYSTDEAPTDEDTQRAFNYMAPEIADPPEVQKVIDVEKMSFELAQPLHVQGVPSASFDYQRDDTELPRVKGVDVPIP